MPQTVDGYLNRITQQTHWEFSYLDKLVQQDDKYLAKQLAILAVTDTD